MDVSKRKFGSSHAKVIEGVIKSKTEINFVFMDVGVRIDHDGTHVAVGIDLIGSDQGVNLFFDSTSSIFCRISASFKGQIIDPGIALGT